MGWIADHTAKSEVAFFDLVEIFRTPGVKLTNCEIALVTDGTSAAPAGTWLSFPFTISGLAVQSTEINNLGSFEIGSADWNEMVSVMRVFLSEGFDVAEVKVYRAWIDPNPQTNRSKEEENVFEGVTDGPEWVRTGTTEVVRMSIQPPADVDALTFPNEEISPSCPFQFKDTTSCQYVGSSTQCLRTLTACQGQAGGSNEAHFGGKVQA